MSASLRIGTRGSALALAQAELVVARLGKLDPAVRGELVVVKVSGDAGFQADKSRWVDEIEIALQREEIDLAVHSAKDVPQELADGLGLLGAPARASAHDALCGATALAELAPGARVGTSSLRRTAQLRAARVELDVQRLTGNLDTRLRRLHEGGWDAIVVARAGLERLGRQDQVGCMLDDERFVPAPGQGTLALEGRIDDSRAATVAEAITDQETFACLLAERALSRELGADCHTPLGALAQPAGCGCLQLRAWVGLPDGSEWLREELVGGFYDPEELGKRAGERMLQAGAGSLLHKATEMALVGG